MQTTTNIEQSFLRVWGVPAFGLNTENADASFRIQFWFYPPPSNLSADDTVVCTVGFSRRYFDGACPWIELMFRAPGTHARPQLEKLGVVLGEFLFETLKVARFTPNLLLTGLKRPFMPGMQDILMVDGAGVRPLWVEMEDRAVRLLHLIPVYREEVPLIREMGCWNTYRSFIEHKINFLAPNRPRLTEKQFHPEDQRLAREVAIYEGAPTPEKIWQDIRHWYQANAPLVPAAQLARPPASTAPWVAFFGLPRPFADEVPPENPATWLERHWERLYAGAFLPGLNAYLRINPYFILPDQTDKS